MCVAPAAAPAEDVGEPGPAVAAGLLEELATANRILARHGVVDAFGHISVRHPGRADRFLLARNMAPGQVTAGDIVEFDLDGNPVTARGRRVYLERFIHSEILKARPDVMSVVHSHSPSVIPFGVVKTAKLRPICHMSGFLGRGTPVFEIRECEGDASSLLITNPKAGAALARTMGEGAFALMRGHGSTVAAGSIKLAVYRAYYAEVNARLQLESMRLGEPEYLTAGEALAAERQTEGQVVRAWDLWASEVQGG